jgi:hypothetical protein
LLPGVIHRTEPEERLVLEEGVDDELVDLPVRAMATMADAELPLADRPLSEFVVIVPIELPAYLDLPI